MKSEIARSDNEVARPNNEQGITPTPPLPKLDCNEYVRDVGFDFARRGIFDSTMAKKAIKKAKEECNAENKRRGY